MNDRLMIPIGMLVNMLADRQYTGLANISRNCTMTEEDLSAAAARFRAPVLAVSERSALRTAMEVNSGPDNTYNVAVRLQAADGGPCGTLHVRLGLTPNNTFDVSSLALDVD